MSGSSHFPEARVLRTVFLDRDGILNEKMPEGRYVTSWSEFKLLPGVPESLGRLNRAGMRVIVVSNQRCIALGICAAQDVEAIHIAFQNLLLSFGAHVDAFYFCPHNDGQCNCRKPLPGLYELAVSAYPDINSESSVMIGDSLSDIEFGRGIGMLTVLVDGNPEGRKPGFRAAVEIADLHFPTLTQAVDSLLNKKEPPDFE